ncbi:hypothetical protein XPA_001968 [Xanthoria parietina]
MAAAVLQPLPILTAAQLPDPDFQHCSIRYGIDIRPSDCLVAGASLPSGPDPETYWTNSGGHDEAYTLPWSRTYGQSAKIVPEEILDVGCTYRFVIGKRDL